MRNFALGLVCGVVAAVVAVFWSQPTPENPAPTVSDCPRIYPPAAQLCAPATNAFTAAATTEPEPATASLPLDPAEIPEEVRAMLDRVQATRKWLTPEHSGLIQQLAEHRGKSVSLLDLHERFAREEPDPQWAYESENMLNLYLGPEAARRGHELVAVSCRSSVCEIQLRSASPEARNDMYRLIDSIYLQSWGNGFGFWQGNDNQFGAQRVTLVAITRKQDEE